MSMKNKLMFVKYAEKIRMAALVPTTHKSWKDKV